VASYLGLESIVKRVLVEQSYVNVDSEDDYGRTFICWAASVCEKRNVGVVKLLVEAGATIDIKWDDDETPLLWATRDLGDAADAMCELLLQTEQADVHGKDEHSCSRLSLAAESGKAVVVKVLLETYRVDPNSKDHLGRTPLMIAIDEGHDNITELLLLTDNVDLRTKAQDG